MSDHLEQTFASTSNVGPRASLARNTLNLALGQITTTTLTILLTAAVARSLGPIEFGVLYLVTSIATFAYVFVDWGHGTYIIGEVARHPQRTGALMGTVMVVRAATVALLIVPAVFIGWLLGYDHRTLILIAGLMAAWLPMYLGLNYGWAFRGIERMEYDAIINVTYKLFVLIAATILLAMGGKLTALIGVYGLAGVAMLAVGMIIYWRLGLARLEVSRSVASELLVRGAPMVTMTIAVAVQPYIDANMLSRLASREVLGWHGAATTFSNTLIAPAFILASAAYPRLSIVAGYDSEFRRILRETLRVVLFAAVLGGLGTYLFADVAVGLVFSKAQFGPSAAILRAFAPAMVLVFIDMMLATAIFATGKTVQLASAKILAVAVTVALEFVLIPICQSHYGNGGIGVMASFAGGEIFMVGAAVSLMPRGALDRSMLVDALRGLIAAGGTLIVFYELGRTTRLFDVPICILVFTVLAMLVGLVTRHDLKTIAAIVQRRQAPGDPIPTAVLPDSEAPHTL